MNLNKALTAAITKGSMSATRKPIASLRADVAELKRQVTELKRLVRALQKQSPQPEANEPSQVAGDSQAPGIRPTGPMVRKLRAKLGLTQVELAKLIGVSGLTISKWETAEGRIVLRSRTLEALARVRAMGKREAKAALAGTTSS